MCTLLTHTYRSLGKYKTYSRPNSFNYSIKYNDGLIPLYYRNVLTPHHLILCGVGLPACAVSSLIPIPALHNLVRTSFSQSRTYWRKTACYTQPNVVDINSTKSQAILKARVAHNINSKLTKGCHQCMITLSEHNELKLI